MVVWDGRLYDIFYRIQELLYFSGLPDSMKEKTMVAPSENPVFNHRKRLPNFHAANSGTFQDRYHNSLSAAGSSQSSPRPAQYSPYCYDRHACLNGANEICPRADNGRVAFKRKATTAPPVYQNDYGYSSAGSSTTFLDPRNNFQQNPEHGFCRSQPLTRFATSYSSNDLLNGQELRNVRSRHGDAPNNPGWQSSSSNQSRQLYMSANNFFPNGVGHGGHPLPGSHPQWILSTGAGCSSYAMNQPVTGNVLTGGNTSNHGAPHYFLSPTFHASVSRGTGAGPSRYSHRQIPSRTSSTYQNICVSAAAFKDAAPLGSDSFALSRNPRQLNRSGGLRISNEAQPLFNVNAHFRWSSQVSDMVDVPHLDLLDEHRDLRLDIDDMSYEELLALEERIGNVNAGLSEDYLPSCLTVTAYCSSTRDQEVFHETSCPICLEEYRDKDNLGMMKCHHFFHVSCIKDWLSIKNACPICKTPALDDIPKKN